MYLRVGGNQKAKVDPPQPNLCHEKLCFTHIYRRKMVKKEGNMRMARFR